MAGRGPPCWEEVDTGDLEPGVPSHRCVTQGARSVTRTGPMVCRCLCGCVGVYEWVWVCGCV